MRKFRIGLIAFAAIIIAGQLLLINYQDFSWKENRGSYLGILSMVMLIVLMLVSIAQEKKKSK